ncbi:hypothetical protein MKW94_022562, partial [Papaver nudicaule]|nr:hypothetical protein [Papaver nudicaule]
MGEIKQLGYAEEGGFEMKISGNVILEDVKLSVNLERALLPSTRMGGHFVQGHVDGTGEIVSLEFEWFIAVDGTSLTVCKVFDDEECFNFMLVAYTQQNVVIPLKKLGQKMNLEVDILG